MTMTARFTPLELARAEVDGLEEMLERLETVPGSWVDWDDQLTCKDRQAVCAEECAQALADARKALAALEASA